MSVAEKSIQALAEAPRQPSEGTIDQVRELLFGETQRQNDTRAEDLQKMVDALEAKLSRRLDQLEARLTALAQAGDDDRRKSLADVGQALSVLGKQINKLGESAGTARTT